MKHFLLTTVGVLMLSMMTLVSTINSAEAKTKPCWIGMIEATDICPPPPSISGKVTSTEKFRQECVWLKFPVGTVKHPVVFFTKESDARCLGKNWKRDCPECTDWIHGLRGPVNGPAAHAVIALRLHDGLGGLSVPRDAVDRIRQDGGWCDYGRSAPDASHRYDERPW
jgi:hypothetical protein